MGIRTLHRRTAMSATVVVATVTVTAAVVPVLFAPVSAVAANAGTAQVPAVCRAPRDPDLAARMSRDLQAALSARRGAVSVAVHDDRTGLSCAVASDRQYDAASIAKVMIMEGVLRRAESLRRGLTRWELANVRPMITRSDNASAVRLWTDLGRGYLSRFLSRAGTSRTVLGPKGYFGLTRTTADDQMRLLDVLTDTRSFLKTRGYGLRLLTEVRGDQRWGVPSGMPRGLTAHLKNGWLPRATHGWRVHSVGAFTGPARTYRIVVLTHDNPTMAYGVRTIERIAQAVHRGLARGRGLPPTPDPATTVSERSDGSAPYGPLPGWDEPEQGATP
ncbi:serine hydrolase [Streptomyces sp. NPDC005529]|uniref:serine hydrolase n=1 Tax=unclassified Streptomyces TaxID=2593676 RepID=UPI0033B3C0B1